MNPTTILLIDDDAVALAMLARHLTLAGYRIRTAADPVQAGYILADHPVDFIVTDYEMPGMTGLEFCRSLTAAPQFRHIPVGVVSSETDPALQTEAHRLGARFWMRKDVAFTQLRFQIAFSTLEVAIAHLKVVAES